MASNGSKKTNHSFRINTAVSSIRIHTVDELFTGNSQGVMQPSDIDSNDTFAAK